ncbi:ribonuclease P protein subunit aRpr2 [Candidatus Mancarchaeum acidiphilum]|uniref:Ribonuclease P protein subunit aRpr2 n=1 Tax=Candidatus Mancarchaeum acidiphilum TaxID=1920749 RepID=A0A218NP35_9ARCH|nr:ribonuclease P Rpr2/Rpp21/SNM1 subunit [Candidatus Mancarchaeum acidiphilum]ASI14249.1 ribonuclease P protein subunit aRpr2 [Candidatus Mancarchaeum acidiphilum]
MHKHKSSININKIANDRVRILFDTALLNEDNRDYAAYCISEMRKISSHHRIKLSRSVKDRFCRKCNSLLVPGETAEVRILKKGKEILYKCNRCGTKKHIITDIKQ